MNESHQKGVSSDGLVAVAIYYIVSILLSPVALIGWGLWTLAFLAKRKPGVSITAQAPLIARSLQHQLGTRHDEASERLLKASSSLPLAIILGMGQTLLAYRASGYLPISMRYPFDGDITLGTQGYARQTVYDRVLQQNLPKIAQFVILGAGFDTRALNLPKDTHVQSFEIDTPATQTFKREMLAKAKIDSSGVTFVPADFEKENWLTNLIEAGFDPNKPSLFIWEGVTPISIGKLLRIPCEKLLLLLKGTSSPLTTSQLKCLSQRR